MIVVDVNILIYHEIQGPLTPLTKQLLSKDPQWLTSTLWSFEFIDVLATMMRAKVMEFDSACEAMRAADAKYRPAEVPISQDNVLQTARRYGISGYDAQYIALAEQLELPCVTPDAALCRKAPSVAILLADFVK